MSLRSCLRGKFTKSAMITRSCNFLDSTTSFKVFVENSLIEKSVKNDKNPPSYTPLSLHFNGQIFPVCSFNWLNNFFSEWNDAWITTNKTIYPVLQTNGMWVGNFSNFPLSTPRTYRVQILKAMRRVKLVIFLWFFPFVNFMRNLCDRKLI